MRPKFAPSAPAVRPKFFSSRDVWLAASAAMPALCEMQRYCGIHAPLRVHIELQPPVLQARCHATAVTVAEAESPVSLGFSHHGTIRCSATQFRNIAFSEAEGDALTRYVSFKPSTCRC